MTIQLILENEPNLSREEYVVALSRLVEEYAQADPLCAKEMLHNIGYSEEATNNILFTAHAVTVRNS